MADNVETSSGFADIVRPSGRSWMKTSTRAWRLPASAQVGGAQVAALLELLAPPVEGDGALLHDERLVGVRQHADVLLDDDDGRAVVVDLVDYLEHGLGQLGGQAERGLVDEKQTRLAHQCPADREH